MSTLSLHDLQGISAFSNKIRVPSGHRLTFDGALKLRNLSTANLPATGNEEGDIVYNTDTKQISIWTGAAWTGSQDGSTAEGAVSSAKELYDNGIVTSGKSYRYINTPNGGVKRVWCDFDTQDQFGNSGWMLVAAYSTDYEWTFGAMTQSTEIGPTASGRQISSNFGDYECQMFRQTIDANVDRNLGSSALADWYFYNSSAPRWKEWWAYGPGGADIYSGNNYSPYMYNDGGGTHDRQMLRPFTSAYNLKWGYNTTEQTHMSLCDATIDSQYPPNIPDASGATANVTAIYWTALTTPGRFFSVYYQRYANGSTTSDGSMGILPTGNFTSNSAAGQDLGQANVHTGYDDGNRGTYIGGSASANMSTYNYNSQTSYGGLYWWVK